MGQRDADRSGNDHRQQGGVLDPDHTDREATVRLVRVGEPYRRPGITVVVAMPPAPAGQYHHDEQGKDREPEQPSRVTHRNHTGRGQVSSIG